MTTTNDLMLVNDKKTLDRWSSAEEEVIPVFPSRNELINETILDEPNHNLATQTTDFSINGGSDAFGVRDDQFWFSPPTPRPSRERFNAFQKWEGYVLDIGEETFRARLVKVKGEGSDQESVIFLNQIDEEDRDLIKPGAVFYWSIGFLDGTKQGRIAASIIRFRRLAKWTKNELMAAKAQAAKFQTLLNAESSK